MILLFCWLTIVTLGHEKSFDMISRIFPTKFLTDLHNFSIWQNLSNSQYLLPVNFMNLLKLIFRLVFAHLSQLCGLVCVAWVGASRLRAAGGQGGAATEGASFLALKPAMHRLLLPCSYTLLLPCTRLIVSRSTLALFIGWRCFLMIMYECFIKKSNVLPWRKVQKKTDAD